MTNARALLDGRIILFFTNQERRRRQIASTAMAFLLNGEKQHLHSLTSAAATATAAATANSLLRSTAAPGSSDGTGTTTTGATVTTANISTSSGVGSGKDASGADGNSTVASTDSKAILPASSRGGTRTSMSSSVAAAADAKYLYFSTIICLNRSTG